MRTRSRPSMQPLPNRPQRRAALDERARASEGGPLPASSHSQVNESAVFRADTEQVPLALAQAVLFVLELLAVHVHGAPPNEADAVARGFRQARQRERLADPYLLSFGHNPDF